MTSLNERRIKVDVSSFSDQFGELLILKIKLVSLVFQSILKIEDFVMDTVSGPIFVIFGSHLGSFLGPLGHRRLLVVLGALGTHGKRQGAQVGATNRMLAVQVDQNPAVNDVVGRTPP